ncbi:MAG: hypothetical protein ACRDCG_00270 [Mycoplasmoidaceae bacterium]
MKNNIKIENKQPNKFYFKKDNNLSSIKTFFLYSSHRTDSFQSTYYNRYAKDRKKLQRIRFIGFISLMIQLLLILSLWFLIFALIEENKIAEHSIFKKYKLEFILFFVGYSICIILEIILKILNGILILTENWNSEKLEEKKVLYGILCFFVLSSIPCIIFGYKKL